MRSMTRILWTRGARTVKYFQHLTVDLCTEEYWNNFLRSLTEEWRSSFRSLYHCGKEIGWGRVAWSVSLYPLVISFIVLSLVFLMDWERRFDSGTCLPDGRFSINSGFNLWAISSALQISMGFGALSFSNAKLLDVIWDLVIGRGGQGLLAVVAYKVTTKILVMSMEDSSIPVPTFEAVTLQDATLKSFWKQLCNFLSIKSARHRLRILWILLSTLFIVAFPTLAGSLTGYAPVTESFVRDQEGQLAPLARYRMVKYIVHDADRVGLPAPLLLTTVPRDNTSPASFDDFLKNDICVSIENTPYRFLDGHIVSSDWDSVDERCRMLWHFIQYAVEYGYQGSTYNTNSSTFNRSGEIRNLPAPPLNIQLMPHITNSLATSLENEAFFNTFDFSTADLARMGETWVSLTFVLSDDQNPGFRFTLPGTNTTLSQDDLNRMGTCQQTTKYKFGFSFLLLFIILVLFIIWIIGTYFLWLDAYLHSKLDIAKRDMGIYRAALDVSSIFNGDINNDIDALTPNWVLKKRLNQRNRKATIGLESLNDSLPSNTRRAKISAWGKVGGYKRWTPRFILLLFILPCLSLIYFVYSEMWELSGVMISLWLVLATTILILGRDRQRAQWRKTSHYPSHQQSLQLSVMTQQARPLPSSDTNEIASVPSDSQSNSPQADENNKGPSETTIEVT